MKSELTRRERLSLGHSLAAYDQYAAAMADEARDWSERGALYRVKALAADLALDGYRRGYCEGMAARCFREAAGCEERRALALEAAQDCELALAR